MLIKIKTQAHGLRQLDESKRIAINDRYTKLPHVIDINIKNYKINSDKKFISLMPHFHRFISESEFFSCLTKVQIFTQKWKRQVNLILQMPRILTTVTVPKLGRWMILLCEHETELSNIPYDNT